MAAVYKVGQYVWLYADEFKVGDVVTDPAQVKLRVKTPKGIITEYLYPAVSTPIIRVSAGNYKARIQVVLDGHWTYGYQGIGICDALDDTTFTVVKSIFG